MFSKQTNIVACPSEYYRSFSTTSFLMFTDFSACRGKCSISSLERRWWCNWTLHSTLGPSRPHTAHSSWKNKSIPRKWIDFAKPPLYTKKVPLNTPPRIVCRRAARSPAIIYMYIIAGDVYIAGDRAARPQTILNK